MKSEINGLKVTIDLEDLLREMVSMKCASACKFRSDRAFRCSLKEVLILDDGKCNKFEAKAEH